VNILRLYWTSLSAVIEVFRNRSFRPNLGILDAPRNQSLFGNSSLLCSNQYLYRRYDFPDKKSASQVLRRLRRIIIGIVAAITRRHNLKHLITFELAQSCSEPCGFLRCCCCSSSEWPSALDILLTRWRGTNACFALMSR